MSLIRFNRSLTTRILSNKKCMSTVQATEEEYTATPQYPPILDISTEKVRERKKAAEHEAIKAVKTVEEKQIKLNMPKYYGFKCYMFREDSISYNSLKLAQHITKTHLIRSEKFAEFYNGINVDAVTEKVKNDIEEAILMHFELIHRHDATNEELTPTERENKLTDSLCKQINRAIISNLRATHSHVKEYELDYEPRLESFWFAGGMNPPLNIQRYRKGQDCQKDRINEPTDRAIQYIGSPVLTLRASLPLEPLVPLSEAENPSLEVPYYKYDPRVAKIETEHRHIANIPGYWPGETKQFGVLSYNNRGHLLERNYGPEENTEMIHRQGILGAFGWLNAQANMLGFTTFNDVTYPLVTQLAITNGKFWSFYAYQMNTLLVHGKNITENKKRNICWATPEMKLFEEVSEGKVIGLNEEVLKNLVKFYANQPQERLGVNLRPYLSTEEKVSADYEDDDKRQWLEREYKHLSSNRPRAALAYEIYLWEKIYKIDFETRFMEKRMRPFELFQKPSNRKLNDRLPRYIPRVLRPDLPRNKGRYAKEYFP